MRKTNKSACYSIWSIDAFLSLCAGLHKVLSPEIISRVESFIDAYILFDQICIPERYLNDEIIQLLNSDGVFIPVSQSNLKHSDHLRKGATIDFNLRYKNIDNLLEEDRYWFFQHKPQYNNDERLYKMCQKNFFTILRLWQWGLVDEIAEKYQAVPLFPKSLVNIEVENDQDRYGKDFILEKYRELSSYFQNIIISATQYVEPPFKSSIKGLPPFFALWVDRSLDRDIAIESLMQMKRDYKEFNIIRKKFIQQLHDAQKLNERQDVLDQWESAWFKLAKNQFKKPSLRSRILTIDNIKKFIFNPKKTTLENVMEWLEYRKDMESYKMFRVFSNLNEDMMSLNLNKNKLESVFNVKEIKTG